MAVLKDYCCPKHGEFESREAKCPMKGCETDVYVLFKKAPSFKSDKTKSTDKNLKQLAIEYDMTDIKSTREGEHQTGYMPFFIEGPQRDSRKDIFGLIAEANKPARTSDIGAEATAA